MRFGSAVNYIYVIHVCYKKIYYKIIVIFVVSVTKRPRPALPRQPPVSVSGSGTTVL